VVDGTRNSLQSLPEDFIYDEQREVEKNLQFPQLLVISKIRSSFNNSTTRGHFSKSGGRLGTRASTSVLGSNRASLPDAKPGSASLEMRVVAKPTNDFNQFSRKKQIFKDRNSRVETLKKSRNIISQDSQTE